MYVMQNNSINNNQYIMNTIKQYINLNMLVCGCCIKVLLVEM